MPASVQILVGHGLPLLERMGRPTDIALLNFGAWHGTGDGPEFRQLVEDFRDAVADRAGRLPRLVWKEMVPTHYDQHHGLYPGKSAAPGLGHRGLLQGCAFSMGLCSVHAAAHIGRPQRNGRAGSDGLGLWLSSCRMHMTASPTAQDDHSAAAWLSVCMA